MQFLSGLDDGRYSIPLESVGAQDEGGKYKSVMAVSDSSYVERPFARPTLKRGGECKSSLVTDEAPLLDFIVPHNISRCTKHKNILFESNVPVRPDFLMPHFFRAVDKIPLTLDEIKERVNFVLSDRVDIAYQFVSSEYTWNVLCLNASLSHKAQIHVYRDFEDSFLIEVQRLSGTSKSFNTMYLEIKDAITGSNHAESVFTPVFPLPEFPPLSEAETSLSLAPIVSMLTDQYMECQLEGAKILCDMTQHEGMHGALREAGCIEALVSLVSSSMEGIRQHAVLALANLSSTQCCQEVIISAGILPNLLSLIVDGPYSSTVMSRESARLFANLSDRLAARVVNALGEKAVREWMHSVDGLGDAFLKQQAMRARYSLAASVILLEKKE